MTEEHKELYHIVQEECAELIQCVSKILRFGYDSEYNNKKSYERLQEEVGDVLATIELLEEYGLINMEKVERHKKEKFKKLEIWSNLKMRSVK